MEKNSMPFKIHKKIKVTPYCAAQAPKSIVRRDCYLCRWIELLRSIRNYVLQNYRTVCFLLFMLSLGPWYILQNIYNNK